VLFGLCQLLLPIGFLAHFGYGPQTIPAYQTVDNKLDYQRIQSTLRGANPLGAYLVVIIGLVAARLRARALSRRWVLSGWLVLSVICLWFTYSRSAYLGVMLALGVVAVLNLPRHHWRRLAMVAATGLVLVVLGVVSLRNNNIVQNSLFHSDETSRSALSSNSKRASALQQGLSEVVHEPLGRGPGTAGPASTRNTHPARIAEDYYLQIGQEVGWIGLALFLAIVVMTGKLLWRQRHDWLARGLLASLVGLSLVNLLSHAWADDTLGLLWGGLAGMVVGSDILGVSNKQKHDGKTTRTNKN
jgi:O-antigen ligase